MKPYTLPALLNDADDAIIAVVGLLEHIDEQHAITAISNLIQAVTDVRLAWAHKHNTEKAMTIGKYIDELSGDVLDSEGDIIEIAYDAERLLNRSNWYAEDGHNDALYWTDPLNQYGDRLWALIDDGGREGRRWIPVHKA